MPELMGDWPDAALDAIADERRKRREAQLQLDVTRRALVEAVIPLEVLHGQDSLWHPPARLLYRKVVSEDLRDQIAQSVAAARTAICAAPDGTPNGVES